MGSMFFRRILFLFLILSLLSVPLFGADLRVLPEGELPDDVRLGDWKTLNDYFPFTPIQDKQVWQVRAERLRRQLQVATGIWPRPTKTPTEAVVWGRVNRDDYTVERVYLQSYPGFFVTGSLYRPKGFSGRRPGVMSPHGHWADGRFYAAAEAKFAEDLKAGAEKYSPSGRYPIQARCVQLARMGCVVFQYDMVGYADSLQLDHRAGIRPEMDTAENWGLFSPKAEAHLQTINGIQTYNSIRALDWFSELPDVDPQKIAVTGASGGGTQTFLLCAIDPRPAVAFPAVMVSTAMQGGCPCENASYLRVGTGNIEIAALIAPRPLGMTAADDWTKELATKGFPELKAHYQMQGVPDLVGAFPFTQFGHNYNYVSRNAMYNWMNKHLRLGAREPIVETDFVPLTPEEMTVWNSADHPAPPKGDDFERSLLRWMTEDSAKNMRSLEPRDEAGLAKYREVVGGAVDILIGRGLPKGEDLKAVREEVIEQDGYRLVKGLVRNLSAGEEVPVIRLVPKAGAKRSVIWLDPKGKVSLFDQSGEPNPVVKRLLNEGAQVVGVDLFGQGELTPDGKPVDRVELLTQGRRGAWLKYAGYTYGYNYSIFSKRVHDVLTVVAFLKAAGKDGTAVDLVGLAGAGHWAAAARAQAGGAIEKLAIDTGGFRFSDVLSYDDEDFLPGGAKYGDLPGLVALSAPFQVWLAGEGGQAPRIVDAAFRAAGASEKLSVFGDAQNPVESAVLDWLLR